MQMTKTKHNNNLMLHGIINLSGLSKSSKTDKITSPSKVTKQLKVCALH